MARFLQSLIIGLAVLLAAAPGIWAQQGRQTPRIGYVYPAGGRQGATFEVTIGGQFLAESAKVSVSGAGVQAETIDFDRPPSGKELTDLRELMTQARKQVTDEAPDGKTPGPQVVQRLFIKMAKEKNISDKLLEAFRRYNQQRNDPKRQLNPQLSESVRVRITVAADAATGLRELRLKTPNGLSNPLRFAIGQLPELLEIEPNNTMAAATVVAALPVVLNGQIMPGDVDRFRFPARKGQRLVVQTWARELMPYLADTVPGWFQAVITLYDSNGRAVAYADGYRYDPDPVLFYEVPQDGDYLLEVKDSLYRGREDFVYRVTVGELPFITGIFPLGVRRGEHTMVSVTGWNLPPDQPQVDVTRSQAGVETFRVNTPVGFSNAVPLAVSDLPEVTPQKPGHDAASAAMLKWPVIVNGRIGRPGDGDVFRFEARQGDEVVAEVTARRLGSPLDSLLKITDAAGQVLAVNDDYEDKGAGLLTHQADSLLTMSIPKTGDYLLWLGDAQRNGGPEFSYRLRLSAKRPDFDLRVVPSAVNARGGMTVPVTVYALRRDGFSGAIGLRLKDALPGFTLSGASVPAGQDSVRLTLTIPAKLPSEEVPLNLEGFSTYAAVDGRELHHQAVAADDMMQAFAYHHLVPAESWIVAVEAGPWNRTVWEMATDTPVKLAVNGTATVHVGLPPRMAAEQLRLELSDPPEGLSIAKVTPAGNGLDLILHAAPGKVKSGRGGNLIINAFMDRKTTNKTGQVQTQRVPLGTLPALPFEVGVGNP